MKSIIHIGILIFFYTIGHSQNGPERIALESGNNADLYIQRMDDFYKNRYKGKGSGWKIYQRWKAYDYANVNSNGTLENALLKNINAFNVMQRKAQRQIKKRSSHTGYWEYIGLDDWTCVNSSDRSTGGWLPGNGRVNEIAIDPNNSNIIYVGTADGGLWKSTNAGNSWNSLTDGIPNLAVSGIAIDHSNSNTIYILTGDGDSPSPEPTSIGVLKSTDAGATWETTGLVWTESQNVRGYELKMHPDSNNILFCLGSNLRRSRDFGATWITVSASGNRLYYDIEFHPSDPSFVYASRRGHILVSDDHGVTWNTEAAVSSSRIELAVTEDAIDWVYAVAGDADSLVGVYRSTNKGDTWFKRTNSSTPNILASDKAGNNTSTQAFYDLAIEVDPNDKTVVYVAGINMWKSTNSGANTWTLQSHWDRQDSDFPYVHGDYHELLFDGNTLYMGNDGGIYKTTNGGSSFTDLSSGLGIHQIYHFGITEQNANLIYSGAQDNGTMKYTGSTTAAHVRGADGFESLIHPNNSSKVFSTIQNGGVYRSDDGGLSYTKINSNTSNSYLFDAPLLMDPTNPDTFYLGGGDFIKYSTDGTSFNKNKNLPLGRWIELMAKSKDHSTTIFIVNRLGGTPDSIYFNNDFFANNIWQNINSNLPTSGNIRDLEVSQDDDRDLFICYSGYTNNRKVYFSNNRGNSWTNISGNLPNVPVWCVKPVEGSINNAVYIGTSLGVFYRDDDLGDWIYFSNGLPSVVVYEIEINYTTNKVYAGTNGRGLWNSDTYATCPGSYALTPVNDPSDEDHTGRQRYEASSWISSTRIIKGGLGSNVRYQGANYVLLKDGFHAKEGSVFEGKTGPCGTGGGYLKKKERSGVLILDNSIGH